MLYKAALLSIIILLVAISSYDAYAQTQTSVKLLKTFGYLDSNQHFVVFGEVVNEGASVQFVEVIVQFFDQELKPLTSLSGSIAIERLHTGQISPFAIMLADTKLAPLVKSFTVSIGNFSPAEEKPRKLDILFHEVERSGEILTIHGRVANDGSALSGNTKAMVVLYNALGEPVRYAFKFTDPRNVLPFSSGTFSININIENAGTIAGYAIYTESSVYAEVQRLLKMQPVTLERLEETVNLTELNALNQNNQLTNSVVIGEPVLLTVSITNNILERQQFMYILQIKDQNGFVVSLSWIIDSLDARETNTATIAWVPLDTGTYEAEAFIWKNLEEAIPLSFRTLNRTFMVT